MFVQFKVGMAVGCPGDFPLSGVEALFCAPAVDDARRCGCTEARSNADCSFRPPFRRDPDLPGTK